MADFNQKVDGGSDPSYIGYSRETDGGKAWSGLIKNAGSLFSQGVTVVDEEITAAAKRDTQAAIESTNIALTPAEIAKPAADGSEPSSLGDPGAADEPTGDEESVFGGETLAAHGDINTRSKAAERLTAAYKAGKISPTLYWGRMNTLSKELRAQYPGYTEVVDKQFQGILGQQPANAYAKAQRSEYTKAVSSANREEKKYQTDTKQFLLKGWLPPDFFDRAKAGKPYEQIEVYQYAQKKATEHYDLENNKSRLALAKTAGDMQKEDAVGTIQNDLNLQVSGVINDALSKPAIDAIYTAQAKGEQAKPEELDALRVGFAQLRAKAEAQIEQRLRAPTANGQTYHSLLDDPGKMKQIKEQSMAEFDTLEKLLADKDFGLFAATANSIKARQDGITSNVLKAGPTFGYIDAIKKNGGGDIVAELTFKSQDFREMKDRDVKALVEHMQLETVAGAPRPMKEQLAALNSNPRSSPDTKKQGSRVLLDNAVAAITNPKSTSTSQDTAAENLFGSGNSNFLAHFPPQQQADVYSRLVSPGMTTKMAEIKGRTPERWNQYREWAKSSFIALQRTNAASIQEGISERANIKVEWDAKNNQFITSLTAQGKKDLRDKSLGKDTAVSGVERWLSSDVDKAVTNMNAQIKLLEGVLKVDGTDVTKELDQLLAAMNISTSAPAAKTFFSRAREALDKEINPPETAGQ